MLACEFEKTTVGIQETRVAANAALFAAFCFPQEEEDFGGWERDTTVFFQLSFLRQISPLPTKKSQPCGQQFFLVLEFHVLSNLCQIFGKFMSFLAKNENPSPCPLKVNCKEGFKKQHKEAVSGTKTLGPVTERHCDLQGPRQLRHEKKRRVTSEERLCAVWTLAKENDRDYEGWGH